MDTLLADDHMKIRCLSVTNDVIGCRKIDDFLCVWVGNADANAQQRGRIRIELYLQTQDTLDVSADYGGVSDE